jgi:ABC-type lipoprotein export system ATPase subunit
MTDRYVEVCVPAPCAPALTRRSAAIAAALGVTRDDLAPPMVRGSMRFAIGPGAVTVITGPSGSGKSTMLRAIAQAAREGGCSVVGPDAMRLRDRPCCDLVGRTAEEAMRLLADAGLADVRAMVRRPSELSEGQRARARVAVALDRAARRAHRHGGALVLFDEFGSGLDDATARCLAMVVRRAVQPDRGVACVVATVREDVAALMAPARVVELGWGTVRETELGARRGRGVAVRITHGTRADLEALAPLHFRRGAPATVELVLRATDATTGALAGVLAVSRPTVHAAWRDMVWPGRYTRGPIGVRVRRINRELRCISRVIVDPRYRSAGIAARLVRAYLRRPLTVRTETITAMGGASEGGGFFARAGMERHAMPVAACDARLADALDHVGIAAWRVADPNAVAARVMAGPDAGFLARELRVWASASWAGRRCRTGAPGVAELVACAARSIAGASVAYAYTVPVSAVRGIA